MEIHVRNLQVKGPRAGHLFLRELLEQIRSTHNVGGIVLYLTVATVLSMPGPGDGLAKGSQADT